MEMPKEAQNLFMQLQMSQQQMEQIGMQKQQFSLQKVELERAVEELDKVKDEDVFKNLGPVIVKSTKEDAMKDLKENIEAIDRTLGRLGDSEKKIQEGAERAQKKLEELLKNQEEEKKD